MPKTTEKNRKCQLCDYKSSGVPGDMARHVRWKHSGTRVEESNKVPNQLLTTPDEIADALLRKVMFWLSEKDEYVQQISLLKEFRNKNIKLTEENRILREERDRLFSLWRRLCSGKSLLDKKE